MKKYLALLLFAILSFMACKEGPSGSPDTTSIISFADSLFLHHVDSADIAGGAIMVYKNGNPLLDKSYGFASLELEVPIPENASFEIGSVTKQFTAAAILKLVEDDKLALDDNFTEYLDFDTKGRNITIDQLLNHTSGIPSYTEIPEFWEMSIHSYPRDTLVRLVEQKEFLFEPGEALIYNNSAYYFLGLIIEKLSGQTYEEYLKDQFFDPLGMKDTYYCSTSKVTKNKVYGYNYHPDGLKQRPYLDHTWPFAAGSLCSTTSDILVWLSGLHSGEVLNQELYLQIITPKTLKDGTPVRYAMGLVNYNDYGHHFIGHGGGINGFLSDTRYFPDEDLYIVCLINTTGPKGAGYFADKITWQLLEKQEYESIETDIDLFTLPGKYTGAVRGQSLTIEVGVLDNAITTTINDDTDTLNTYIGNHTWMDDNNKIQIKDGELRVDQVSGYYVLRRE